MIKILFVCTGNICRSPLAEGILHHKLRKNNFDAHIDSCGFESFHVGDPPDSRAQEVARKRGVDISSHRARLFSTDDFDRFDYIFAMDSSHFSNIMRLTRNDADRQKVDYMLNILYPGQNLDVQDPWYHGMKAFETVYVQLDEACDRIVDKIIAEFKPK
ncbi:MAG: low molecular weight phosphotyrosine protein phosphatase [Bacteroidetes bacterium]|nr:low molecular weight phosphotyrosine protein phosphatase [Bacteroidota bacterium]